MRQGHVPDIRAKGDLCMPRTGFFERRLPPWAILLSVSLTLQVVRFLVSGANLELHHFSDRIMDGNVLRAKDFAPANVSYAVAIASAVVSFVLFSVLALKLMSTWTRQGRYAHVKIETDAIGTCSLIAILLTCLSELAGSRINLVHFSVLLYAAIALTLALVCGKIALKGHGRAHEQAAQPLPGYAAVTGLILFACLLPVISQACMGPSLSLGVESLVASPLLALAFIAAYGAAKPWLVTRWRITGARLDNALTVALCPLMMIPILFPVANELQFALSAVFEVSPRTIALILVCFALAASLLLAERVVKKGPWCRASRLVRVYYFPVLIATSATFVYFTHFFVVGPAVDLFHWGELTVPAQQWFKFGRMPFVDILPTHGLRDLVVQTLYTWINGYRGMEMLIWSYWIDVGTAVLLYFLLARIASPLFSFLVVLGVPWVTWVMLYGPDYGLLILPALMLCRMAEKPTRFRMTMFWLVVVGAFWWRYDVGLFSLAGGCLVLLGVLRGRGWKEWATACTAGLAVVIGSMALFAVVAYVRDRSPLELAGQLVLQLKILGSGQGFSEIWPTWNAVTFLMYCVLPGVYIGYIICFLWERIIRNRTVPFSWYLLTFMAIVSLLLSFRNLHRHGMSEGYSALFAVFLMASVPALLGLPRRTAEIAFAGVILVHIMILGDYSWLNNATADKIAERQRRLLAEQKWSDTYFKTGTLFTFHSWKNKESRLQDNNDWQYRGLKPFCDEYMTATQTFYDFSNGTLLYALADREVVSYLLQGQLHTGEQVQRYQIARMRSKYQGGGLPFVVFKQGTGWDSLDGVPNELRSYRIAEFIYRHFRPCGYVGGLQLWRDKTLDFSEESLPPARKISIPLLKSYSVSAGEKLDHGSALAFKSTGPGSKMFRFLDLHGVGPLNKAHYWFLRMRCRSSLPGAITVHFMRTGQPKIIGFSRRAEMRAARPGNWEEVILPIPISGQGKPDILADAMVTTQPHALFEISSAELMSTPDPLFPRISTITQQLDFKKAPLVWAKYDEGAAWQRTRTLGVLKTHSACEPLKDLSLDFGSEVDKTSGNYLQLKVLAEQPAQATLVIPGIPESCIQFELEAQPNIQDYVIRVSCLWDWMKDRQGTLVLRTKQPIWVEEAILRKGD
jgi:hypothetical protein